MPLGDVFLSAFLEVLFDRLAPCSLSLFPCEDEIRSKLKHWKRKLLMIQAVLTDAEEKQLTNKAVKMWLDDLRDLAYDVEDILDEYATQALERRLMPPEQPTKRITEYFSSLTPTALMSKLNMKSKIEEITSRLEDLCEERDYLGLQNIAGGTSSTAVWQRPPSTCVPTEPAVYGRDDDKAKILEMVLKDEPSDVNFRVIPIVGMGGIGKTTLAREVYNDKRVKDDFNLMAWVCVSEDFDVLRISQAILDSIDTSESCNPNNLNQVHIKLRDKVAGKKFLLVLDDVWSKAYGMWESLRSPLMKGAFGSKMIVTTRDQNVALRMGHGEFFKLGLLSDTDCWAIFEKHAFENRGFDPRRTSQFVYQKVVEKCRGLPLAARTLGGLLRCKQTDGEWEDILNSKIWDLSDDNEIPEVLKLSYYHLPSHLKRCFAYCAIFPKDYEFLEKDLVLLWMAEGLIQPSRDNKEPEDVGGEYFRDLLSRSIFQRSNNDGSKYVMHDLFNDLAQCACGDAFFRLEDETLRSASNTQSERFKKVRYSSYTCALYNGENKFKVLYEFGNLRTFLQVLLVDDFLTLHYITNKVPLELLPKFKRLRVLSLRNYNIRKLPDSIGNLRHLRYLNLSDTKIACLPKSINFLFNLQVLILGNCSLIKKLPPMENLISLRHLEIEGVNLVEMPQGIQDWKYLQTLSNFIVSKDKKFGLENLKDLKFLRGKLCISGLDNVTDLQEAILSDKEKLDELLLSWTYSEKSLQSEEKEKSVLDMLRPHINLGKLTIKGFGGTRFSNWVGDSTYSNITDLKLEWIKRCISLPSLGMLVSLKNLTISWMMGLKRIGCEIYGNSCSKSFQSLETLHFDHLLEWESWDPIDENEYVERFPRLHEISIINCRKLTGTLPNHLPSLKKLKIYGCPQLAASIYDIPSLENIVIYECAWLEVSFSTLCELEVDGCREMVCRTPNTTCNSLSSMKLANISQLENCSKQEVKRVENLEIVGCEQLVSLWQNEKPPRGLQLHSITSLRELFIGDCSTLVLFPEADVLCTLTKLNIRNCQYLTSLPETIKLKNACLEYLAIEGCHSLKSIVRGQLPSSLRQVSVTSCHQLQCLLDDREDVVTPLSPLSSSSMIPEDKIDDNSISCLEFLSIFCCPSLTCLLSKGQLPRTLRHFEINHCSKLTTSSSISQLPAALNDLTITECSEFRVLSLLQGQLPAALKSLKIKSCSRLTTLSLDGQLPERLEELFVYSCPKLESIGKRFHSNMPLVNIHIRDCENLKSMPDGLHELSSLLRICVFDCPNLVSFPGLPNTILEVSIERCEKLEALPSCLHSLTSLQKLSIRRCPGIVTFPEEGFPTNLTSLKMEDLNIYNPLIKWGLHKLTSLAYLWIGGCPDAVSFPEEEVGMKLPASLIQLRIASFPKLKYLSSNGFKNLASLQYLWITNCPNLESFPSRNLLSSVVHLCIFDCPLLEERLKINRGERSKIAHIPSIDIGLYSYNWGSDAVEEED